MSTRHLFNDPHIALHLSLHSSTLLNPSLIYHQTSKSIYLNSNSNSNPKPARTVKLIAGGGGGHEPAHGGYVGYGMLDGAVSGDIFASPSARQIEECAHLTLSTLSHRDPISQERNLLVIINNYTGDILNFGLAIERIKNWSPKVRVESVVVADDVSVGRSQGGKVGRRGLAGNILVCKILGAAAEKGLCLKELKSLGDASVANLASIGLSLDHCHVPGRSTTESLPTNTSSLGMGLHNEPGVRLLSPTPPPSETISQMLGLIFDFSTDRSFASFHPDEKVILYVNNLGGMSLLEIGAIVSETVKLLEEDYQIKPTRILSSSFMTSLNGSGFSITILNVTQAEAWYRNDVKRANSSTDIDIVDLVDAPTEAVSWRSTVSGWKQEYSTLTSPKLKPFSSSPRESRPSDSRSSQNPSNEIANIKDSHICAVTRACHSVISSEPSLTHFDTLVGDGDCGVTWSKGAKSILQAIEDKTIDLTSEAGFVESLARIVEDQMGGTSGGLFTLFLTALSRSLMYTPNDPNPWPSASLHALQTLSLYTPAQLGDRTLIDALHPFVHSLPNGLDVAVRAAREGAESTKGMKPHLGRSVYIGEREEGKDGERKDGWQEVPDPGAWGVLAVVNGLAGVSMEPVLNF